MRLQGEFVLRSPLESRFLPSISLFWIFWFLWKRGMRKSFASADIEVCYILYTLATPRGNRKVSGCVFWHEAVDFQKWSNIVNIDKAGNSTLDYKLLFLFLPKHMQISKMATKWILAGLLDFAACMYVACLKRMQHLIYLYMQLHIFSIIDTYLLDKNLCV